MRRKKRLAHASHGSTLEGLDLLVYILFSVFYMELILRFNTSEKFISIGLLYSLLFSLSLSAGVYLIATLFRDKARNFITSFALIALGLLFSSQLIYFKFFKTFYTVYSAGNGATVMEFMNDIVNQVVRNIPWLIAIFLPAVAYAVFFRTKISSYRMSGVERALIAVLILIPHVLALGGIYIGDKEQNSAYDVYFKTNYPIASVDNLGLFTTMRLDLKRTIFGFDPVIDVPIVEVPAKENEPGPTGPTTPTPTEEPVKPVEYNVMDINFDELIAGAGSDTVKKMHQYFSTLEPTAKNDYTGMFEGYNLILITAEGFSKYAVDKDVTPTLYKMQTEGFNFTNFYNPIWGVSTSDGEYVATTSLIPKSGVWSYYKSGSIYMPFGMGNMMSQYGYSTRAYHNHTYTYYKRNISHPNMGYDYKGVGNGLDVRKTWPESDIEMMEKTVDDFINDEKFHTYYMTVSGHMMYTFDGNFIAAKNKSLVENLPYNSSGKAYMATQIELDRAMEYLLERLEEAGVADKTLIAISADHYPYGLEEKDLNNLAGHTVEKNFELYESSFILYAKGMKPETIDRPVSSLDIIPTINNLMGNEYDSRLLMGIDAFSDTPPLVIFSNRSFISDKGRYNSTTKVFTPNDGVTVEEDYRKNISALIDRKFTYSALILDTDYYAKVLK
ncbi:LTA synthase family protein [Youngiibacter fragilis]|nr:LTA synthase family protein [Youngiibacter fragilis]